QLFLAVFFFFIIAVFTNKKAIRWLALSAFVLFVMCGLLSGTRVFPICLLIGLFIVLFSVRSLIRGDKEFKKRLSSFALVIIFLSVFLISSAPFLFSRVGSFFEYFSFNDTSISFSEKDILRAITGRNVFTRLAHGSNPFVDEPGQKDVRYAVWDVYRKGFLDYYLFGVGLGNSNLYFGNIVSEFGIEGFPRVEAAGYADVGNDYYRVLIELGVVGLMIFLFFLWQLMREFYIAINKTSIYSPIWQMGVVIEVNFIVLLGSAVFWPMLNRKYFWFAIALLFTYIVVVEFMSLRGNNK
ncbi:MAG: O-antigen ligase family protein, partial [Candidatus Saganbacteria bacterium]|nr:O-antigen ligase family protein [Candidatus Saganbacteria bacterium]